MKKVLDNYPLVIELLGSAILDRIDAFLVGAIIFHNEKVLILQRAESEDFLPGLLEIPSGHVENGEGLISGLKRELKEETSLEIQNIISYVAHFDYLSLTQKKKRQFNFIVDTRGEVNVNPVEHSKHFWFSKDEIIDFKNISSETKEIILKAFNI